MLPSSAFKIFPSICCSFFFVILSEFWEWIFLDPALCGECSLCERGKCSRGSSSLYLCILVSLSSLIPTQRHLKSDWL